ncbi:MAG: tetratricopeptide repeat protein [Halapricum sp.]
MESTGGRTEIETLGKRAEFLELLDGEPLHKRDVVDRLDHSRSTVDRAIAELTSAGFVERVTRGFVTTQTGRLAVQRYRSFVNETDAILKSKAVLEPLPPGQDLPASLFAGSARTTRGRYQLLETIAESLDGASRYRAILPRMVDSRHLRLCHARAVRDDLDVSIVAPSDLLTRLKTEFPALLGELADASSFSAAVGETPPYGLLVVEQPDDADEVLLVTYDESTVRGFCRSTDRNTFDWADERFEFLQASATPLSSELSDAGSAATLSSLLGDRIPPQLRTQGFVRLDERFVRNRAPLSPSVSYRAGVGLPEVIAGQSIERFDDEPLTDRLFDRLRSGSNLALVGPPGSGKSTLCKRVARRWFERDAGSVFYRASDDPEPFDAVGALERVLDRAPSPTLVVVEDAVRREASTIFEVLETFAESDDVVFLLDARESEWQQPLVGSVSARIEAIRHRAVETVTMPAFGERECRRLVERVAEQTDVRVDVPVEELLDAANDHARDVLTAPAAIYLVCHRLARYVEPLSVYESTPTTLDEDVRRVHSRLSEMGSQALDVGVLIAVLEAAGCPIYPASLEVLAVADVVESDVPGRVRDELSGVALFPVDDEADRFRGPHQSWAATFLEHHIETVGDAAAHDRMGRCVSALLSLADDSERREALAARCGGSPLLERIVRNPTAWAEDTVDRLFDIGRAYATLAPLFGRGETTAITIPEACTKCAERRGVAARASMLETLGDRSGAEAEYRRLGEFDAESHGAERAIAESRLGLAGVARKRGDFEDARAFAREALERSVELGVHDPIVRSHLELASIATDEGDLERADAALDAGEAVVEDVEAPRLTAALWRQRGVVARTRAAYDAAADAFRQSLDRYEAVSDRANAAAVRGSLGQVANERGDLTTAREQFLRGLERARNAGATAIEADLLKDLGVLAYLRDDYDEAERYFEEALPLARSLEEPSVSLPLLLNGGLIDIERGDYASARDTVRRALERARDIGTPQYEGGALRILALLARETDQPEAVSERARDVLDIARELGDARMEIDALVFLAWGLVQAGDPAAARTRAAEAVSLAREIDHPQKTGEALVELARTERRLGQFSDALEHAAESRRIHAESGVAAEAASQRLLAQLELDRSNPDDAAEHADRAVSLYADDGNHRGQTLALAVRARAERARGDLTAAESTVESATSTAVSVGQPRSTARAGCPRAQANWVRRPA